MTCVALSSSQVACVTQVEPDEVERGEEVAEVQQGVAVTNSLIGNSLIGNSLIGNSLIGNSLIGNSLIGNSLIGNSLIETALHDADAREVLHYVVGCALPAGSRIEFEIDGLTYGFDGELGLAPEWGEEGGSCNENCQEWVSACVLARVNYLGEHVSISVRGEHPALHADCTELSRYRNREAAYYGNIFVTPQRRFACLSTGTTSIPRVCGPSLTDCVMSVVGPCKDACRGLNGDGSYKQCSDALRLSSGVFPSGSASYSGTVTVFLQ
jgi:hypothetical protein